MGCDALVKIATEELCHETQISGNPLEDHLRKSANEHELGHLSMITSIILECARREQIDYSFVGFMYWRRKDNEDSLVTFPLTIPFLVIQTPEQLQEMLKQGNNRVLNGATYGGNVYSLLKGQLNQHNISFTRTINVPAPPQYAKFMETLRPHFFVPEQRPTKPGEVIELTQTDYFSGAYDKDKKLYRGKQGGKYIKKGNFILFPTVELFGRPVIEVDRKPISQ